MERDDRQPLLTQQSFEEVYPQCDFAPLVALALAAGARVKALLDHKPQATRPVVPPRHLAS